MPYPGSGLGADRNGLAAVAVDPRGILKMEVTERAISMPSGPDLKSTPELMAEFYQFAQEQKAERQKLPKSVAEPVSADKAVPVTEAGAPVGAPAKPAEVPLPRRIFFAEIEVRFNGTIHEPKIGFGERLTMFWANHFAISASKGQPDRVLAGAFEREAIRSHIFGRFADMLMAVETHPAMLIFLDNQLSIGPTSKAGTRRNKGLNENLARETLELHTLGVDGGYTQTDVTSLARIITGWTIVGRQGLLGTPGTFTFNANAHEPGPQTVLGHEYADSGLAQGKEALLALARHPATAQHIATKLVRHFVADTPPPTLVKTLANTFAKTDGDLSAVYLALIGSEEAWNPKLSKVRSPLEFMVALLRASGEKPKPGRIAGALNAMGQPLWAPSGPNGFPDTADAWASSEGLSTRMDVAALTANAAPMEIDPRRFVADSFGPLLSDQTLQAVSRAETRNQGLAIAFLSPEFQRR